jgi:hypothetical protein
MLAIWRIVMLTENRSDNIQRLARLGAEQRLAVLDEERNAILTLFPDLGTKRPGRKPKPDGAAAAAAPQPKRRGMNAAQRKAVGARMKKYWAARRAEKQGGSAGQATAAEPARKGRKGGRNNRVW